MTDQEKKQKIKSLQEKKKELSPHVQQAYMEKNELYKTYKEANNNWLRVKDTWEALDREEKLLSFSMKPQINHTKRAKHGKVKTTEEITKAQALKSLQNLPEEIRRQVLAKFK